MKSLLPLLLLVLICSACATTRQTTAYRAAPPSADAFILLDTATDKNWGYTEKNPVRVGGALQQQGPRNERRFLDSLAGPNGEAITYMRQGSCCRFKTKNGLDGYGLLDIYEVRWEGLAEPIVLYLNMYDFEELKIPAGLTARK